MVSALLFDLDGTLLDTANDLAAAANKVLAHYGYPPLLQHQIQAFTSYGAKGLLSAGFGDDFHQLDPLLLREQFLRHYADRICDHTDYYEGVENVLVTMNNNDIPWGIMTNKPAFLTEMLLPFFPLLQSAHVIVSGDTLEKAKPHPDPLIYCASKMKQLPNEMAYIGDIEGDMIAARDAGMKGVIAGWGYIGTQHTPENWPSWRHFNHPNQLLSLLESHQPSVLSG